MQRFNNLIKIHYQHFSLFNIHIDLTFIIQDSWRFKFIQNLEIFFKKRTRLNRKSLINGVVVISQFNNHFHFIKIFK